MKLQARGDRLLLIRVDLAKGRYNEIVVAKHGDRVLISMDGIYGELRDDVILQVEALQVALNIAAIAEVRDDWVAAVTHITGG